MGVERERVAERRIARHLRRSGVPPLVAVTVAAQAAEASRRLTRARRAVLGPARRA
jgi:hypothetical protein